MTEDGRDAARRGRVTLRFDVETFGPADRATWPAFEAACRDYAMATGLGEEPDPERAARARSCLDGQGLPHDLADRVLAAFDDFAASGAHAAAKAVGAY